MSEIQEIAQHLPELHMQALAELDDWLDNHQKAPGICGVVLVIMGSHPSVRTEVGDDVVACPFSFGYVDSTNASHLLGVMGQRVPNAGLYNLYRASVDPDHVRALARQLNHRDVVVAYIRAMKDEKRLREPSGGGPSEEEKGAKKSPFGQGRAMH